jgi:uncharacterized Zn finger protein (UPF0148 family)
MREYRKGGKIMECPNCGSKIEKDGQCPKCDAKQSSHEDEEEPKIEETEMAEKKPEIEEESRASGNLKEEEKNEMFCLRDFD